MNIKTILTVVFFVLIVFLAIPIYLTSSARTCALCHSMKPYYDSWKKSLHSVAANDCNYCHVKQGLINNVAYRILFWSEIYAALTGREVKPLMTYIPAVDTCARSGCHTLNREMSTFRDIKILHRFHIKQARLKCIKCHPGTVHEGVGKIGKRTPPMSLCFECHESVKKNCAFCHIKPVNLPEGPVHGEKK